MLRNEIELRTKTCRVKNTWKGMWPASLRFSVRENREKWAVGSSC